MGRKSEEIINVSKAFSRALLWARLYNDAVRTNDCIIKDDLFIKSSEVSQEFINKRKNLIKNKKR